MKDIPKLIKVLIIGMIISIGFNFLIFITSYDESIKIISDTFKTLPIDPRPIMITSFCLMSIFQALLALGIFFRQNWVRIFYLILSFIGLPFVLNGLRDFEMALTGVVRVYGLFLSLLAIYVLLIHQDKYWFKEK